MSQLNEIIMGWKNYIFLNEKAEKLATKRMKICLECPKLKDNKRCGMCGCFMPAKVRCENATCPLKEW